VAFWIFSRFFSQRRQKRLPMHLMRRMRRSRKAGNISDDSLQWTR